MIPYTDILLRFTTMDDFWTAMQGLGVQCNPSAATPESQMQHVCTPVQVTHQGLIRIVRFTDSEQLARIPEVLSPVFLLDWRSDEEPYEDASPEYTADLTDADGNLYVGAVMPGVIAS